MRFAAPASPPPAPWREGGEAKRGGSDAVRTAIMQLNIEGLDGMTDDELEEELAKGGRFVVFHYCVSVLIMSFKRPTKVRFVRADRSRAGAGAPCSLVSALFGWWGFPWGIVFTIQCLTGNAAGGMDVTAGVLASLGWRKTRA